MNLEELTEILGQSPSYTTVMTRDGTVHWLSHTNYGHEKDYLLGLPSDAIIVEEDKGIWWDAFRRALHDRQVVRFRLRVKVPEPPTSSRWTAD